MAAKVRRHDTVEVMTGKDKGRRGEVRQVVTKSNRVIVTGANMVEEAPPLAGPDDAVGHPRP